MCLYYLYSVCEYFKERCINKGMIIVVVVKHFAL